MKPNLSMCLEELILLVEGEHGSHEPVWQASICQQAAQMIQRACSMNLKHAPYAVHAYSCQLATLCHVVLNQPNQDRQTLQVQWQDA